MYVLIYGSTEKLLSQIKFLNYENFLIELKNIRVKMVLVDFYFKINIILQISYRYQLHMTNKYKQIKTLG